MFKCDRCKKFFDEPAQCWHLYCNGEYRNGDLVMISYLIQMGEKSKVMPGGIKLCNECSHGLLAGILAYLNDTGNENTYTNAPILSGGGLPPLFELRYS